MALALEVIPLRPELVERMTLHLLRRRRLVHVLCRTAEVHATRRSRFRNHRFVLGTRCYRALHLLLFSVLDIHFHIGFDNHHHIPRFAVKYVDFVFGSEVLDHDVVVLCNDGKGLQLVLQASHDRAVKQLHRSGVAEVPEGAIAEAELHEGRLFEVDVAHANDLSGKNLKLPHHLQSMRRHTHTQRGM